MFFYKYIKCFSISSSLCFTISTSYVFLKVIICFSMQFSALSRKISYETTTTQTIDTLTTAGTIRYVSPIDILLAMLMRFKTCKAEISRYKSTELPGRPNSYITIFSLLVLHLLMLLILSKEQISSLCETSGNSTGTSCQSTTTRRSC